MLFTSGISIPRPVIAQAVPYARTYAKSSEEVDKALKEMQAYAGQKLPIVEGFVANADHPLDRYERAFYQFSIDLVPATSGGTTVRVTAKITAWYAERDPWKSGYQVLASNGRLELDLLDRLSEKFGNKPAASASRQEVPLPKSKLDLSAGLAGGAIPPSRIPAPTAAYSPGAKPGGPGSEEVTQLRVKREAAEKHMRELNTELQNLQEIQRNQAHPPNLVVVKKTSTPVLARPAVGSHVLFLAAVDDEFEFLDADGEWIHVQLSGLSRGYIRKSNLDLPEYIAARLKSPNGTAASGKQEAFRIVREETGTFPGNWEALRGKPIKIYTIQPVPQDSNGTSALAKLNFAFSLFQKFSADSTGSTPVVEGVAVIFDSADGGIIAATLPNVRQVTDGSIPRESFWKLCYVDPPGAFQPTPKP
jgi:hypothetical protein